ncbi:MAG: response regulator [Verrucomicrobia bacterium]|nr:response regulator [Verrucomicrobiota bacterium]
MKLTALIVDDEPLARERLRTLLGTDPEIVIAGECSNGREAVAAVQRLRPDLLFLDIQMPELDGFQTLAQLNGPGAGPAAPLPAIIFVTAFDQHAVRAFEIHALDYLLKPLNPARLRAAVARAREQLAKKSPGDDTSRRILELLQEHTAARARDEERFASIPPFRPASVPAHAVFLSYASQDLAAARRIGEALRAAGVEVWLDQSALRGGEVWDATIRRQIKECTLFLPIISATTQARPEGYFRLEWRLADQRTHLMSKARSFLVPITIDDTAEADADVPDSFLGVQWTRLPAGDADAAFCARVKTLVGGDASRPPHHSVSATGASPNAGAVPPPATTSHPRLPAIAWAGIAFMVLTALALLWTR